ncbi:orotate phosphoribosyltransferase [Dyadobacter chenwenxiniae]|uniref:Orotate phosphoribosyltransferase n=1 Tax=Dyadobacter chenwenxiniae TaxID=2906456 RepID=A0A9X1PKF2_9BACT|nr:orotate phosphoribosyltransferase [Dyadobacter chenwenxiniae]MCF0048762.1 orotate phosphoribosyltransferase [Dyadobacter chenwenxiniae]MCF0062401.1 orotate phosphoribosyltransferase [Dyadobacter chenwenxiniae]UON83845.1 orotate phosphoribosyltransferase [Dyadobacter chenwenxiniae]
MLNQQDINKRIAELLLEAQAIKLSPDKPFQWSSGWLSPIYCDNRVALSYPDTRTFIKKTLAALIKKEYPDVQAVVGVATGGIAQGALVADLLELPFAYVRPEPKKHGMGNQIEGRLEKGQSVIIIEDLISTGGSSLKVVDVLRAAEIEVAGMVAIFTYGFAVAENNFKEKNVKLSTVSNYNALIETALEHNYINSSQLESLSAWRLAPETWGK